MQRRTLGLLVLLMAIGSLSNARDLNTLQRKYEVAVEKLGAPIAELETAYEGRLTEIAELAQQSGDLELMLAAKEEVSTFRETLSKEWEGYSALVDARKRYVEARAELASNRDTKVGELNESYRRSLALLVATLTRENRIEEALAAKAVMEAIPTGEANSKEGESRPKGDLLGNWTFD
ncbi:MAG: hypothetical protein AAGC68_06670 [Verrucomicrobiota bacterium]